MSEKKPKLIELGQDCKKKLTILAAHNGTTLKPYIEKVLEDHANNAEIPEEKQKQKPAEKREQEKPLPEKTPMPVGEDFDIPAQVEKVDNTVIATTGAEYTDMGDPTITKDERKGAFARAEPNIYTNNKVWQCRMFDKKENKLVETYWRTKQEAIVARDKLKC